MIALICGKRESRHVNWIGALVVRLLLLLTTHKGSSGEPREKRDGSRSRGIKEGRRPRAWGGRPGVGDKNSCGDRREPGGDHGDAGPVGEDSDSPEYPGEYRGV
jgi:hypothetical protein